MHVPPKSVFSSNVLAYQFSLHIPFELPNDVEWILPYKEEETRRCMTDFYEKYYSDHLNRRFILGINPGRFGAGVTGVPFTDPIRLEKIGIENTFQKRQELSSVFIYDMIQTFGGPDSFYQQFYISSLSPLGFLRHGKNYNYYDDNTLSTLLRDYIIENIQTQIQFGADRSEVYCLGQGKNFTYLENLNREFGWWDKVVPLPHPRWIMQYKLKRKAEFIKMYLDAFR
ncbi:MAG: DUF4918 family protein [Bacteroidota bacterium]|nr:DUF4918 family protein [Bacteroidota bacterium]